MTTGSRRFKLTRGVMYCVPFAMLLSVAGVVDAGIAFRESFNTDTSTTAQTLATYRAFSFLGDTLREVRVMNGVMHLPPQGEGLRQALTIGGFPGDLTIDVDLGKNPGGGDSCIGLRIGENDFVFHPGLPGEGAYPQGSFRVEGPGYGSVNGDMGFVPEGGNVLHHMRITVVAATGQFDISVTDANNPANVYHASFTNEWYEPGDPIGFVTHGYLGDGERFARFDNLTVDSSECPEPPNLAASAFKSPMGNTREIGSTLPVKFQLYCEGIPVTSQKMLEGILVEHWLDPAGPQIQVFDVTDPSDPIGPLPVPDNAGGRGRNSVPNCFRFGGDGKCIYNLKLDKSVFQKGGMYLVQVTVGEILIQPENKFFDIKKPKAKGGKK
jgi:hypothetical protein